MKGLSKPIVENICRGWIRQSLLNELFDQYGIRVYQYNKRISIIPEENYDAFFDAVKSENVPVDEDRLAYHKKNARTYYKYPKSRSKEGEQGGTDESNSTIQDTEEEDNIFRIKQEKIKEGEPDEN